MRVLLGRTVTFFKNTSGFNLALTLGPIESPLPSTLPHITIAFIMAASKYLEIDGSVMEGGGQILRNTVSLAALLKRPIRITRIRAKRDKPGMYKPLSFSITVLILTLLFGSMEGLRIEGTTFDRHSSHL